MSAYHEYQIECSGFTFSVEYHYDADFGAPWEEHDGHGPVSDWEQRDKKPGELILCEDRGSKRFYNYAEACRIALRDGWGAPGAIEGETKRQKAARAAMSDFKYLRGWCNGDWHWVGIVVKMLDAEGEETGEEESVWGFDSCLDEYLRSEAERMAEDIAAGVMRTMRFKQQGESVRASIRDARGV